MAVPFCFAKKKTNTSTIAVPFAVASSAVTYNPKTLTIVVAVARKKPDPGKTLRNQAHSKRCRLLSRVNYSLALLRRKEKYNVNCSRAFLLLPSTTENTTKHVKCSRVLLLCPFSAVKQEHPKLNFWRCPFLLPSSAVSPKPQTRYGQPCPLVVPSSALTPKPQKR